jgi:CRP-like cAMP-binding protein
MILMCDIPEDDRLVDEVVKGRVQFLNFKAPGNALLLEQATARCLNYVTHGDKSEFHVRFLASEEALMREGEKADNVYLLKKGRMRAMRKEHVLGHVEVGEFVGEMAYINGEPRSADVIADLPCELIEIPVQCLDHVLFQKPAWSKALMRTLSRRLKTANMK